MKPRWAILALRFAAVLLVSGCNGSPPTGSLVLTQVPVGVPKSGSLSMMDQRYPAGSRLVIAVPPFDAARVHLVSKGLLAAGDPVVSPDAQSVYFAGKQTAKGPWQIYRSGVNGGHPKQMTFIRGGAMQPALLPGGVLVFSSPVPTVGGRWKPGEAPALHAQRGRSRPERLTFGMNAAVDPTVLADGRILFVLAAPAATDCGSAPALGLFTINNDGTELTHFALDHDGPSIIGRPRELPDGFVTFLASIDDRDPTYRPESVRKGRPFASRTPLWEFSVARCGSIEPSADGSILACLATPFGTQNASTRSMGVYRVAAGAKAPGNRVWENAPWDVIEAIDLTPHAPPMGHVSAIVAGSKSGTILCLNSRFTRVTSTNQPQTGPPQRIRVVTSDSTGVTHLLGEMPLQPDGSFMAEVPADTAFGFQTLDAFGRIVQQLPPTLWVRPGENRSCIGCHEPPNRSPRNLRPMAVTVPPVDLTPVSRKARPDS